MFVSGEECCDTVQPELKICSSVLMKITVTQTDLFAYAFSSLMLHLFKVLILQNQIICKLREKLTRILLFPKNVKFCITKTLCPGYSNNICINITHRCSLCLVFEHKGVQETWETYYV